MMKTAAGAALLGVAVLTSCAVMGCAGNSQAQVGDSTSPDIGSGDALVLRVRTTGGIAGLGVPGSMPEFSLYGDGRVITDGPHPMEYHLTRRALRRLIADARKAGLATPRTADNPRVADAMYKVITFVAGGRARTTKVIEGGGDPSDPAVRFLPRLAPASWPESDQSAPPRPYRPARVAVLAGTTPAGGTAQKWPLKPLASSVRVGTRECTVLTGGDVAKAERLMTGRTQWRDHGTTYRVVVRPLLPDERDCAALNHPA
jgi:hypothetical protein